MDVQGMRPRFKVEGSDYHALAHAGDYFRANIWAWRPLRLLCAWMNDYNPLGLNMDGWHVNDGHGLKTQYDCDLLASALQDIDDYPCNWTWEDNPIKDDPFFDQFLIYIDREGTLQVARTDRGELDLTGVEYALRGSHFREWIAFLYNCGGFEIW
jgi:hypothetical protein